MYVIGLTGGIASGKSTVSNFLRELGAVVIDADAIARQLANPQQPLWQKFVERFGEAVLLADKSLDRKKIGAIVFADKAQRRWLDKVSHPLIEKELRRLLAACKAQQAEIVVLDVPLLYEVQWDKLTDEVWVVYVDEQTQLERLQRRDAMPESLARQRIAAQLPLEEKARKADFVIDNMGLQEKTKEQVRGRWSLLESRVRDV